MELGTSHHSRGERSLGKVGSAAVGGLCSRRKRGRALDLILGQCEKKKTGGKKVWGRADQKEIAGLKRGLRGSGPRKSVSPAQRGSGAKGAACNSDFVRGKKVIEPQHFGEMGRVEALGGEMNLKGGGA